MIAGSSLLPSSLKLDRMDTSSKSGFVCADEMLGRKTKRNRQKAIRNKTRKCNRTTMMCVLMGT